MTKVQSAAKQPARAARKTRSAAQADKHLLYQEAVQAPDVEIAFIDRVFRRLKGRTPSTFREDFCGTGLLACQWAAERTSNRAVGLDIHAPTLAWGKAHNVQALPEQARQRVQLIQSNVLTPPPPPTGGFDAIAAYNFSYWLFTRRETLLNYFQTARKGLAKDGILFLDFMGGSECQMEVTDRTRRNLKGYGPFTYVWEHASFEPISGRNICKIHFEFPAPMGSERKPKPMRNAFVYEWRLWSVPELRDLLDAAGFSRTRVYWEGEDEKGRGNGVYRESTRGTADRSYVGYIVAER